MLSPTMDLMDLLSLRSLSFCGPRRLLNEPIGSALSFHISHTLSVSLLRDRRPSNVVSFSPLDVVDFGPGN